MIQAMDLARENAVLRDEVDRLRKELAQIDRSDEAEPSDSFTLQCPHGPGIDHVAHASSADARVAARLVLVMPRHLALDCGLSGGRVAGLPDCSVIVDRRLTERRREHPVDYKGRERRRRDRRSGQRSTASAVVVSLR